DAVDDVAAIAGQRHAILGFLAGRTRLRKLACNPADLHHGLRGGIGENDRHLQEHAKKSRMLSAPCSRKLSAQSPPCSRKDSPAATEASCFFSLRASPANTSGGKVASLASTSCSAASSG